jgi:hypothetical protein
MKHWFCMTIGFDFNIFENESICPIRASGERTLKCVARLDYNPILVEIYRFMLNLC